MGSFFQDEKHHTHVDAEIQMASGQEGEEIKRDLRSRHINMIAIAGMIVSVGPIHA
jgi:amino acid transporter